MSMHRDGLNDTFMGCNASPVITEMKLSSDIIYVSKQYDVSVTASDPKEMQYLINDCQRRLAG